MRLITQNSKLTTHNYRPSLFAASAVRSALDAPPFWGVAWCCLLPRVFYKFNNFAHQGTSNPNRCMIQLLNRIKCIKTLMGKAECFNNDGYYNSLFNMYKSIKMQKNIYIFDERRPIYEAEFVSCEKRMVIVSDDECMNNLKKGGKR